LARAVIVGSGLAVCLLLAWGHLGLGAYLFPPAPSAAHQAATAGTYTVVMTAVSGQMVVGRHNDVTFDVRDQAQRPITGATMRLQADMTTMAMPVPPTIATDQGSGRYVAHPFFSMAGPWRLTLTIAVPGHPDAHATFDVSVRWHP
jgi:hypothetical protein